MTPIDGFARFMGNPSQFETINPTNGPTEELHCP